MRVEYKMEELVNLLVEYKITDATELTSLEAEILPLKEHLDSLLNRLLTIKEQALYAPHYSEIEFEKININGISALFTTARVDRDHIPRGYQVYDIRSSSEQEFAAIESFVVVDYNGTILTEQLIEMSNGCSVQIVNYLFLNETVSCDSLTQIKTGIQELVDIYNLRFDKYLDRAEKISRLPNDSRGKNQPSPSYLREVIIPIYRGIAEMLLCKNIEVAIPDINNYNPIKDYYRVKVGGMIVGGFSVPNGEDNGVYFTPFNRTTPMEARVKIESIEQLCQLILIQLNTE